MSPDYPQFKPSRAATPDAKRPMKFPRIGSPKMDGIRMVKLGMLGYSKSMKTLPNLAVDRQFITKFSELGLEGLGYDFDGELLMGVPNDPDVYNRTYSTVMSINKPADGLVWYVFDLPLSNKTALERKYLLDQMVKALPSELQDVIQPAEWVMLEDQAAFDAYYNYCIERGYEGVVTHDPAAPYHCGKCSAVQQQMLKHKPEEDFDAEVLAVYEAMHNANQAFTNELGATARSSHAANLVGKNMLGGFVVRDVLSGNVFKVAPGKLTEAERIAAWQTVQTLGAHLDSAEHIKEPLYALPARRYIKYRAMDYGTMTNGAARHGRFYAWLDSSELPQG